ncbi:ABC transporter ATP-binding protein [Halorubrum sp. DTA46]|uniref:ABC transporter ATP-binding protein n=1 Tax=Halorubrum sp. DTA46 TaxID=3402162 RepID=UPI003AAFFE70
MTTGDRRPIAALDDVTRTYGGVPVLDGASLAVEPGVTAVVGPNGSGKSTLLGLLAGTVTPTTGTVRRPGAGESGDGVGAAKPIGYLPQRVPFRGGFTARETLAFYARLVGADPDAALDRVGLSDARDRRVEALSGGMKRLLGIAQATLGDPSLVVLDEPASGLDPGMRERAFRTAAETAAGSDGGRAVVLSSHDLGLVDAYADTVVLLARGGIVAAGALDVLRAEHDVGDAAGLYRALAVGTGDEEPDESGVETGDGSDGTEGGRETVHVTGVSEE